MSNLRATYRFLTVAQVRRLYITFVAEADPSQPTLLESAVNSPINVKHYGQENDLFKLAATPSEKIMKNHAYTDGNKRAALVAADMFLKINGYQLQTKALGKDQHSQELAAAHVAVTTGEWDCDKLGQYYRRISTPILAMTPDIATYQTDAAEL